MIRSVIRLGDSAFGLPARFSGRVRVGSGSSVRWRHLKVGKANSLVVGNDTIFRARVDFDSDNGEIVVGDRTFVGRSHLVCHSRIDIGNDVLIAWGVTIVDHNSHSINWMHRASDVKEFARGVKSWHHVGRAPVVVRDRAWIGFNTIVLMGVTIGEGAVIGAGAVVTKDVPAYSIAAGNPARVIRELTDDER